MKQLELPSYKLIIKKEIVKKINNPDKEEKMKSMRGSIKPLFTEKLSVPRTISRVHDVKLSKSKHIIFLKCILLNLKSWSKKHIMNS